VYNGCSHGSVRGDLLGDDGGAVVGVGASTAWISQKYQSMSIKKIKILKI
jgi:hypothetical protein